MNQRYTFSLVFIVHPGLKLISVCLIMTFPYRKVASSPLFNSFTRVTTRNAWVMGVTMTVSFFRLELLMIVVTFLLGGVTVK